MEKWQDWIREYWKIGGVAVVVLILLGGYFFVQHQPQHLTDPSPALEDTLWSSHADDKQTDESESIDERYYIDVKGAVKRPGMYAVEAHMRVLDAIEQAGGFTDEADQNQVNLAMKLTDQMVLFIPKVGENIQDLAFAGQASAESNSGQAPDDKINLNTADVAELQQLNGIGQKKAEAIIDYREQNGSFQAIEDITKVSGIGQQTFEKLKDHLSVSSK